MIRLDLVRNNLKIGLPRLSGIQDALQGLYKPGIPTIISKMDLQKGNQ